jgi:hypothetical protein
VTAGDGPAPPGGSERVPDSPDPPSAAWQAEEVVSLREIRRTEAIIDALAARRGVPPGALGDPAVGLLVALSHDVDPSGLRAGAPAFAGAAGPPSGGRPPRLVRRVPVRALATGLVAAAAVLVTAIVARPLWPASGGRGPAPLSASLQPAVQRAGQVNAGGSRSLPAAAARSRARTGSAGPHGTARAGSGPAAGARPGARAASRRAGPALTPRNATRQARAASGGPAASSAGSRAGASGAGGARGRGSASARGSASGRGSPSSRGSASGRGGNSARASGSAGTRAAARQNAPAFSAGPGAGARAAARHSAPSARAGAGRGARVRAGTGASGRAIARAAARHGALAAGHRGHVRRGVGEHPQRTGAAERSAPGRRSRASPVQPWHFWMRPPAKAGGGSARHGGAHAAGPGGR